MPRAENWRIALRAFPHWTMSVLHSQDRFPGERQIEAALLAAEGRVHHALPPIAAAKAQEERDG